MSWIDRIGDAWGAVTHASTSALEFAQNTPGVSLVTMPVTLVRAPVGLISDIATAPWNDGEEYNGFLNTLLSRTSQRFAEDPAHAAGATVGPALTGYSWLWSNAVSQPTVTLQMMERQAIRDPAKLFSGTDWAAAYHEAEHTSPGQYYAASVNQLASQLTGDQRGIGQYDLTTAAGVQQALAKTPGGSFISGTYDLAFNLSADPTVGLGKGVKALNLARTVVKPGANIDKVVRSTSTSRFIRKLMSFETPEQKTRWLYGNTSIAGRANPAAMPMVDLLAHAADEDEVRSVLRLALTPDPHGIAAQQLALQSREAAAKLEYLTETRIPSMQAAMKAWPGLSPDWGKRTLADLSAAADTAEQTMRVSAQRAEVAGTIFTERPRLTAPQQIAEFTRGITSEFVQPSLYNVPVRMVRAGITKRPGVLNFHEPDAWVEIGRYMRQAGVDDDTQGRMLARWNEEAAKGVNAAGKRAVAEAVEVAAKNAVADRAGLPRDLVDAAFEHAKEMRARISAQLESGAYTSIKRDNRYIDLIAFDDGHIERWPIFLTQTRNYHALLEVQDMVRVMSRYKSELRGRTPDLIGALHALRANKKIIGVAEGMEDVAQAIHNIWKPSVLISARYVIRNVTDEMLRSISTFGVISMLKMSKSSIAGRHAENKLARNTAELGLVRDRIARLEEQEIAPNLVEQLRTTEARLVDENEKLEGLFSQDMKVRGINVAGIYGDGGASALRAHISARDTMQALATDQGTLLHRMRAQWSPSVDEYQPGYEEAYRRAVNGQIRLDPVGLRLLQGQSDEQILDWLKTTPGRAYRKELGRNFQSPENWLADARTQVETYVPTPELRALGAKRDITAADLRKAVEPGNRPVVHGENLALTFGTSSVQRAYHQMIERVMDALGAAPNDVLLRHPFANLAYLSKMDELLRYTIRPGTKMDDAVLAKLQAQSRLHARRKVQETLYDLSEQPNVGRTVRFIMPFYGAWNDFVTRWAKIFMEDPSRLGRAAQIWTAPERSGLLQHTERGEVIVLPLPDTVKEHLLGAESLGSLSFSREDLLGITSGPYPLLPGSGPLVAVPVAAYARGRPDLAESLKFLLPYGPGESAIDQLFPAWAKRFAEAGAIPGFDESENRAFAVTKARITGELIYEREVGKNDMTDVELLAEAERRAKDFYKLRAIVNLAVPAPDYASPYQFYWDKAQEYRQLYGETPGVWQGKFLQDFGEEYFAFTSAMSHSLNGITPTKEGFEVSKQYSDLIAKHPDMGWLIAGDLDDSGNFSQAVYEWQFRTPLGPGDTRRQRTVTNPAEMIDDLNRSRGWRAWMSGNELITGELTRRGLNSLAEAPDLAAYKAALRKALSDQYPSWYADYQQMNTDASAIVDQLSTFVFDKRFDGRAGFASLRDYIRGRQNLTAELIARDQAGGSANLQADLNADLKFAWDTFVGQLVQTDIAFGQIYDRVLEGDLIQRGL